MASASEAAAKAQAKGLIDRALEIGRKIAPGAALSVTVTAGRRANTRFGRSEITSTGDVTETELSIQVTRGQRHAAVRTNQSDAASLTRAIDSAARICNIVPADPEHLPPLGPQRYAAVTAAYDPASELLGAGERAQAAGALIDLAEGAQVEVAGLYSHEALSHAIGNSAGLFGFHRGTLAELSLTARTREGSGWAGAVSPRSRELDAAALGRVAIDKAVRARKPQRLAAGRYTVVLEPAAVADLMQWLVNALNARPADEGRSVFARPGGGTRLGEKLFPELITLRSDPTDARNPAAPFDGEGLARAPLTWIDRGTLSALSYSRFWAHKQGKAATGAPAALQLLAGTATPAQLLAGVQRGVLITRLWYTRMVDPQSLLITGLTRDGVFLIERGELVAPVNNFRFNESPVAMLRNAELLGGDAVRVPGFERLRVPALRTHDFNLASISEAI